MTLHLTPDAAIHYSTLVADEDQIIVELAEDWLALHAECERLRAALDRVLALAQEIADSPCVMGGADIDRLSELLDVARAALGRPEGER